MTLKSALAAAAALTLAACGSTTATSSTDAVDNGPNVVVAFYPLEWASIQVMGEIGSVSTLTAPGVEPHDLELTPKQVASLADADLVIYLSDFQSAVDDAIAAERGLIVADTKFEFGTAMDTLDHSELVLADEVLTPDSSRYWAADEWERRGGTMDRQMVLKPAMAASMPAIQARRACSRSM